MNSPQQPNEWFTSWFNSPFYHLLYDHRDQSEAQDFLERLCGFLDLKKGTTVLDLACGSGRHSRVLHQLGFSVSGADLSPNSIAEANQFAEPNLSFFVHDMRNSLPENYDVVMNLFTSFGYFESISDNLKALQCVHSALNTDGILVIDFMNAEKIARELLPRQEIKKCDVVFNIKREVVNQRIVKTIAFQAEGESHFFQEKVQALTLNDFETLFQEAGFELSHIFGNYQLEPFDVLESERLILICKKR